MTRPLKTLSRPKKSGAKGGRKKYKSTPPPADTGTTRLLAIDSSSTCVGFAVFDGQMLVAYGKYVQQGDDHGEKLSNFRAWLLEQYVKYAPDQVVYEAPFSGRRRFTFGILSFYVSTIIESHFTHFGTELHKENKVAAHMVKRLNAMPKGASHESNKKAAVLLANKLYSLGLKFKSGDKGKKISDDDIADSILLGRAWRIAGSLEV